MIKLIPKPKGGKRPIGLLTALIRLWERLRIEEVRAWKGTAFRDYNWAARGRSAQDAVWKQSVLCEAAAWRGHDALADLYDLDDHVGGPEDHADAEEGPVSYTHMTLPTIYPV